MKNTTKETWTYEAKCRKCGNVNEFCVAFKESMSQHEFSQIVIREISHPFLYPCRHCKPAEGKVMKTVHDVISTNL